MNCSSLFVSGKKKTHVKFGDDDFIIYKIELNGN